MGEKPATVEALRARIDADPQLAPLLFALEEASRQDPRRDVGHALRVATWTLRCLPPGQDERAAVAAALLHDSIEPARDEVERTRASERNAARAARLLTSAGFTPEAVREICLAIREHHRGADGLPASPVGAALQDADRLESLGTSSLLRTVATGTRRGAGGREGERARGGGRLLETARFFIRLLRQPELMRTAVGRAEAERRARAVRRFLAELADDLEGPIVVEPEDPDDG